jgi:hypothetical protein
MRTNVTILGMVAAMATVTFALPGVSRAGDVKIFPGASCKPTFGNSDGGFSYLVGLFNSELPGWDVTCPIVRDVNGSMLGFRLALYASPGSDPLSCTAYIRKINVTADSYLDFETRTTPTGGDNVLKLDWGTSLSTGGVDAVYFLQCAVPVYGLISGYRVDEL